MGNMFFILHNKVAHILFTESGTLYIIIIDLPLNKNKNKKRTLIYLLGGKKKKSRGLLLVSCFKEFMLSDSYMFPF